MKRKNSRARHTDTTLYTNSASTGKGKGKKRKTAQQPKTKSVPEPAPSPRRHLVLCHPHGLLLSSPGMVPSRCGHTATASSVATRATCCAPLLHNMCSTHRRPTGSRCQGHPRTAMATLHLTDLVLQHLHRHQPPAPRIKLHSCNSSKPWDSRRLDMSWTLAHPPTLRLTPVFSPSCLRLLHPLALSLSAMVPHF
jgi:hypothetical protein